MIIMPSVSLTTIGWQEEITKSPTKRPAIDSVSKAHACNCLYLLCMLVVRSVKYYMQLIYL